MICKTVEQYAAEIQSELFRLKAGVDSHPYSGLSIGVEEEVVSIYDDYNRSEISNPERFLELLKTLEPIVWEESTADFEPIWKALTLAES